MSGERTTYTTEDEIQFIKSVKSKKDKTGTVIPKLQFLTSYKSILEKRYDWGYINSEQILKFLDKNINEEEKKERAIENNKKKKEVSKNDNKRASVIDQNSKGKS